MEEDLSPKLDINIKDYMAFKNNFTNVLKKHAPKRTKKFRGNYRPHIFKTLRLAIVKGSRLKSKANKTNELAINKIIENNKTKLNMH